MSALRTCLLAFVFLLVSCDEADPFDPLEALAFIEGSAGQGSGVFIAPNQVLTAWHVVDGQTDYVVTDSRGSAYKVESFNHILYTDAVVLTLAVSAPVIPAKLSCAIPERLDKLIVAGAPAGIKDIVTYQHVAGYGDDEDGHRLLTTGMLVAGMSGGPVYNMRGELLGISVEERGYNVRPGLVWPMELNGVVPLYDIVELCKESVDA